MGKMIYFLPGNENLASLISKKSGIPLGSVNWRSFPDGETYLRLETDCGKQEVMLLATLPHPNDKILPLLFLTEAFRELGSRRITLVAPYLAYMRQDRRFHEGEGITSRYFAQLLSRYVDGLITVDPHLHRYHSLNEIYSIPNQVLHATPFIADWIRDQVKNPLLIGPDSESEQWVADVAGRARAPYVVLNKIRQGDRDVEVSIPQVEKWLDHTPVLVDDIISSGRTMIETIGHLKRLQLKAPECIGIHAVFSEADYQALLAAGAARVTTTNTIPHESNGIDISDLLVSLIERPPEIT